MTIAINGSTDVTRTDRTEATPRLNRNQFMIAITCTIAMLTKEKYKMCSNNSL